MVYTITLNPAVDYVIWLERLKTGDINRAVRESAFAGGKGINVSAVLKSLDVETAALGFAAGFTGGAVLSELGRLDIRSDFVLLKSGLTRINVKLRGDGETDINGAGPYIGRDDLCALLEKLDKLGPGDAAVISGSAPRDMEPGFFPEILEKLRSRGAEIVADVAGEMLLKALEYRPFLIKPNREELAEIFGGQAEEDSEVAVQAERLRELGARNVLVSLAGSGAMLLSEDGEIFRTSAPQGELVNSVGAGDSMVAGFLAGYLKTGDYRQALKLGTAAGSATAFSEGLAGATKILEIYSKI